MISPKHLNHKTHNTISVFSTADGYIAFQNLYRVGNLKVKRLKIDSFSIVLEHSFVYLFCFNHFCLKVASTSQLPKQIRVVDLLCTHVTSRSLSGSTKGFSGIMSYHGWRLHSLRATMY